MVRRGWGKLESESSNINHPYTLSKNNLDIDLSKGSNLDINLSRGSDLDINLFKSNFDKYKSKRKIALLII